MENHYRGIEVENKEEEV